MIVFMGFQNPASGYSASYLLSSQTKSRRVLMSLTGLRH